jgi:response regulator RpfG family c-di-GMP phosphodiesterase
MAKANYTVEMTEEVVAAYSAAESEAAREEVVAHFAEKFGKNSKSVRAKLVREGVYVKKEYKTKTGGDVERKDAIVENIASALGVSSDAVGSLEKATKKALTLIRAALVAE